LWVEQECEEDMSRQEMRQWVESHFAGCDYGAVEVLALNEAMDLREDTRDVLDKLRSMSKKETGK